VDQLQILIASMLDQMQAVISARDLTPKALNYVFWQCSNFGQLTMNGVLFFFL